MAPQSLAYLLFSLALSVLFLVIIIYYYSRKRHRRVEEPKYRMLEEDD
ncbi:CcoQ/FixQ family Cbb3-type cytochrome c oxidase assembly chaperone [Candidatus Moduliflexota bacterium]|jgi:cbb3-type cytochrome oxidase subunit 3